MKKSFLVLVVVAFSFLFSDLMAVLEEDIDPRYYGTGGTYDENAPDSAWIWIDVDGDFHIDYIIYFPNPSPFSQSNPADLDLVKAAKLAGLDYNFEISTQTYNGETRYILDDAYPS